MATTDGIKQGIISELQGIVGDDYVVYKPEDLIVYEYDGSADKAMPAIVVIPETAGQVAEVVKLARRNEVPIVARGAGTGLSGGAVAENGRHRNFADAHDAHPRSGCGESYRGRRAGCDQPAL